ncbi:transcription factor Jra-like isoform X3 [Sitodiplosis mosellana]|uniref:transcription factor Jra-like isoform X3 n=1 Tax=Sitodiplosis mosellana TaxID=263140 RepID=UPI0024449680|nr:transcription factor Jra-like isoform X3 [Sitodiplosis mosellana]XP_055312166.1 transcription factor Jra-like isoform X3 [Sitodiplosis mosellana]XP_055312168.1 transcription factor Jra-like isoform X3 [Sitodiplosis mosellana]XP_055312169.1 transcription factor Jra-like isoform X3 [Sitodiplosis mosellana]
MKTLIMHENRNNTMESFYEENGSYVANATQARMQRNLKRPESLDLNLAVNNNKQPGGKRARCNQIPAVLASPDINMLKWGTPDLEKFIMSTDNPLQTPTPSIFLAINPDCQVKEVTDEQEEYAQPFVDALNHLRNSDKAHLHPHPAAHHQQQQQQQHQQQNNLSEYTTAGTTGAIMANPAITTTSATTSTILSKVGMSGGSVTYTNLDDSYPVTIKDEPQTVPNSPPMSPIDMESQEKIKLERKRQRNRVAASKCRKRKLERISKLEDKVKLLKGENIELSSVIKQLKEHVIKLKQEVIEHINNGCMIPAFTPNYLLRPTKATDSDIK